MSGINKHRKLKLNTSFSQRSVPRELAAKEEVLLKNNCTLILGRVKILREFKNIFVARYSSKNLLKKIMNEKCVFNLRFLYHKKISFKNTTLVNY